MITKFVPEKEYARLLEGGSEVLDLRVHEAASKASVRIFGIETGINTISTRATDAVVCTEDHSKFARIQFELSEKGEIQITKVESLDVPVYDSSNVASYIFGESDSALRSYLGGDRLALESTVRELWGLISDDTIKPESGRAAAIVSYIQAPKKWHVVYEAKLDHIKAFLKELIQKLENTRAKPKFQKLYDGTLQESELEGFRELVSSDLGFILDRYRAVIESVTLAVENARSVLNKDSAFRGTEAAVVFTLLGDNLQVDTSEMIHRVDEAIKNLRNVESFAIVYDTLAEELHAYETAGTFLNEMTSRLVKASSA